MAIDLTESLIAVVYGFGIMSLAAISFGIIERSPALGTGRGVLHGVVFGTGAILAMMQPVPVADGVIVDLRATIVGLAAAFGGAPAAIVASAIAATYRISLGGAGALAGVTGIVLAAILGRIWAAHYLNQGMITFGSLMKLGLFLSGNTVSILLLPADVIASAVATVQPALITCCLVGAVVMGGMIARERGNIRSERFWRSNALTDPLTQLPNRRGFEAAMVERIIPYGAERSHALLIIDADHFKSINDQHGHAAGDAALVFIAERLRLIVREGDPVCRLGGEEFAVMIQDAPRSVAHAIAVRICHDIHAACFVHDGVTIPLSVSIGIAEAPRAADLGLQDMFHDADTALYAAKAAGRNRVVFAAARMEGAKPILREAFAAA